MTATVAAGAPFVILDQSRAVVPIRIDEIGLPYQWKYGPASRNIGDATFASTTHSFVGAGLRPLSPVHVRSDRDHAAGGDLSIWWTRRTRIGGDSWEVSEVPLGESIEAYEVDILDGAAVVRTLAASAPSVVYALAEQVADFGSVQPAYAVRVHQMSSVTGRGSGRLASV